MISPDRLRRLQQSFGPEHFPEVLEYLLLHELLCLRIGHDPAIAEMDRMTWSPGVDHAAIVEASRSRVAELDILKENWEFYYDQLDARLTALKQLREQRPGSPEALAAEHDLVRFLDDSGQLIDTRMWEYPVEAYYPLRQAAALLPAEQTDLLLEVLQANYDQFWSIAGDTILLMYAFIMPGWLARNAPELVGRKVVMAAAEVNLLAGGLGYVDQIHSRFMARLGADVATLEPRYKQRKLNDGTWVTVDYRQEYLDPTRPLEAIGEPFDITVNQKHTRVQVLRGWRRDGVETFLLDEVGEPALFTNTIYAYGSAKNPSSEDEFDAFFGYAAQIAMEQRLVPLLGWERPVFAGNDAQGALASALMAHGKAGLTEHFNGDHAAFTSHTFGNRQERALGQMGHILGYLFGLPRRIWSAAHRLNKFDTSSLGLRMALSPNTVSRKQLLVVKPWDPLARMLAITNGDDIVAARRVFEGVYRTVYGRPCDFRRLTWQEVQAVKAQAKVELAGRLQDLAFEKGVGLRTEEEQRTRYAQLDAELDQERSRGASNERIATLRAEGALRIAAEAP